MKVSIITIVRNGENHIQRTIESVLKQYYCNIEYIIIDGESTDKTLSIINQYKDKISVIVSEPDNGISDAWNKGLTYATGDIVALLNAGDEYQTNTVSLAVSAFEAGADMIYGDTELVDEAGKIIRFNHGRFHLWLYSAGIGFYHPSCLARKSLYDKIGGFNIGLRYAMDTDWIIRAKYSGANIKHTPLKVRMLDGGVSVINRFKSYGEHLHCLKSNGTPDIFIYLSMLSTGFRGIARSIFKYLFNAK